VVPDTEFDTDYESDDEVRGNHSGTRIGDFSTSLEMTERRMSMAGYDEGFHPIPQVLTASGIDYYCLMYGNI